jgi:transposase, IS30 family
MGVQYSQLGFEERVRISHLHADGLSANAIAARLGRAASTVSRELRRGASPPKKDRPAYDAARAQRRAAHRRRAFSRFKLARQPDLLDHVGQHLAMGYSPEQIAGRLALEVSSMRISHESIYRFIYHRAAKGDHSWRQMLTQTKPRRGRRKRGGGPTMNSFVDYVPIDQRPEAITARSQPGHWEADLMAFRQNSQFLLVACERSSRRILGARQPDKTAAALRSSLTKCMKSLPQSMRRSITYDNGPEFALHHKINAALNTRSYFCHTRSPWQKGTVENAIGRLRRYLPRHTSIKNMTRHDIDRIVEQYNQTPRKCLHFLTPEEAFDKQLASETGALQP